jgi:hypothetical protein
MAFINFPHAIVFSEARWEPGGGSREMTLAAYRLQPAQLGDASRGVRIQTRYTHPTVYGVMHDLTERAVFNRWCDLTLLLHAGSAKTDGITWKYALAKFRSRMRFTAVCLIFFLSSIPLHWATSFRIGAMTCPLLRANARNGEHAIPGSRRPPTSRISGWVFVCSS